MGELKKAGYVKRLQSTPREDLLNMIGANCAGVPDFVPIESLVQVCAHGMTYGAMRTVCPKCKTILHKDGKQYVCFGKSRLVGSCNYSRRHVKTSSVPWVIPDSVTEPDLKTLRMSRNYPVKSFLSDEEKGQRKEVIDSINKHKCHHIAWVKQMDAKLLIIERIPYIYFVFKNDDFIGRISHCYGLIYATEDRRFFFYKYEKVYAEHAEHTFVSFELDNVIAEFKKQFYTITGGVSWNSWIEGTFERDYNHFTPLKFDYYSKLDYLNAEKIDEFHEQLVVKLEFLKRITKKEITEVSMQKAQGITLKDVYNAHVIDQGAHLIDERIDTLSPKIQVIKEMMAIVKDRLKLLHYKKEDHEFYSVLSRLLTSPVGTTIRLYDLPTKFEFFQPVKSILNVFFNYMKLKQQCDVDQYEDWPSSAGNLTQEYMLDKTRGFIGAWIMALVFESDETAHHHYLIEKDTGCCFWSVLLRKARKAFDNSSSDCFIICTIDTEQLPEGSNYDKVKEYIDEPKNLKEMFLYGVSESDYNKYGYILHDNNRAKVTMIFPIKYKNEKGIELNDTEKHTWIEFLSKLYSPFTKLEELQGRFEMIANKRIPFIYLGETDEKSLKDYLCNLRSTFDLHEKVCERKRRRGSTSQESELVKKFGKVYERKRRRVG